MVDVCVFTATNAARMLTRHVPEVKVVIYRPSVKEIEQSQHVGHCAAVTAKKEPETFPEASLCS